MRTEKVEKTVKKRRRRIGEFTKEIREFKRELKSNNSQKMLDLEFKMYENKNK